MSTARRSSFPWNDYDAEADDTSLFDCGGKATGQCLSFCGMCDSHLHFGEHNGGGLYVTVMSKDVVYKSAESFKTLRIAQEGEVLKISSEDLFSPGVCFLYPYRKLQTPGLKSAVCPAPASSVLEVSGLHGILLDV